MTAPLDLSLPTDQELLAAGAPGPVQEAERLTRSGNPDQVRGIGRQLMAAGIDLDAVSDRSEQAQRVLAGGFTNDGAPVYDADTHRRRLPSGLRDAGTRLHDAGRRVGAVADELGSAIIDVTSALQRLRADLRARRAAFSAEVAAATAGGPIPVEAIPALQARRTAAAAAMREAVGACGREITARLARYDEVLAGARGLLGELGPQITGPEPGTGRPVDNAGTRFGLLGRLEASSPAPPPPGFTPAPQGPSAEVLPWPGVLPGLPGFTPAPGRPELLGNVPAPGLGAGLQDGPGSGQLVAGPPVQDRAAGPDPGGQPAVPASGHEERRIAAGEAIRNPDGTAPGVAGSSADRREVDQEHFKTIEEALRRRLGPPDRVVEIPDKGRVEIWSIGPEERIVYRDFSTSGSRGTAAPSTIDIHRVDGLEDISRIHVREQ